MKTVIVFAMRNIVYFLIGWVLGYFIETPLSWEFAGWVSAFVVAILLHDISIHMEA